MTTLTKFVKKKKVASTFEKPFGCVSCRSDMSFVFLGRSDVWTLSFLMDFVCYIKILPVSKSYVLKVLGDSGY
jgi:hypothetical protein